MEAAFDIPFASWGWRWGDGEEEARIKTEK
jgi:hypothetical protein